MFYSSKMILLNYEINIIEVSKPVMECDFCFECDDISLFQIDTILFGGARTVNSQISISNALSKLKQSNNLNRGLLFNLENASYNDYIELLDAMISNRIYNYVEDGIYIYLFTNKEPLQNDYYQRCYLNSNILR